MATFPTFEAVLLEIANALGANKGFQTKKKTTFKNNEMNLNNMFETWKEILGNISDEIGLDEVAKADLITNIGNDYLHHKTIETKIFTSNASKQKIIWQYLTRLFIPTFARHTVFWQLHSSMDTGMPGGKFWYLPFFDLTQPEPKMELPVPQVLDWIIDLIEEPKVTIAKNIESNLKIYDGIGTVLRNLYNWQKAKNTPDISSIKNTFSNEVEITFKGIFHHKVDISNFEKAVEFVKNKGLTAETLQHEINYNCIDLEKILKGNCSDNTKIEFIFKLAERYQKPNIKTIRQRLLTARAVQIGYERLVKFLTPSIDKFCMDAELNKTLQLVNLYNYTYNATLNAHLECSHLGEQAENEFFTNSLPDFLRYDLMLGVVTETYPTDKDLSHRLNWIFSILGEENIIEHILINSEKEMTKIGDGFLDYLEFRDSSFDLIKELERDNCSIATIRKIDSFDLIYEVSNFTYSSPDIKLQIINRLDELAVTPEHKIKYIIIKLEDMLVTQEFHSETESCVTELLIQANKHPNYQEWSPIILHLNAYHCIAQNQLSEALTLLKRAIEQSKKYSFGKLRGELARDAFALEIANQKLIPMNHEKYYRDIMLWGGIEVISNGEHSPSIQDISRDLHSYFWNSLYRCYPQYSALFSDIENDVTAFIKDLRSELPIDILLEKHKHLRKKQLKYPQSDSILLMLLKLSYETLEQVKNGGFPLNVSKALELQFQKLLSTLRKIIKRWPDIVNLSDFKQQTPLMLAVNNQDNETVEVLLQVKANTNLKDIKGRTALHAASASRNLHSAKLLIESGIDVKLTDINGSTALHTSVRMGEIPITYILLNHYPNLINVKSLSDETPLQLAENISMNTEMYDFLQKEIVAHNRKTVTHDTYKELFYSLNNQ